MCPWSGCTPCGRTAPAYPSGCPGYPACRRAFAAGMCPPRCASSLLVLGCLWEECIRWHLTLHLTLATLVQTAAALG